MAVRLQFAVMHVPGEPLRERTVARQRVLCGPMPVLKDPERNGPWWNAQRAWQAIVDTAKPGTTHAVLLQDDLDPCDLFVENLTAALEVQFDKPVVFLSWRDIANPPTLTYKWVRTENAINAGTAIPIDWVQEFLNWAAMAVTPGYMHDDCLLAAWIGWSGRGPVYNTVPSLVQHAGASHSSLGHSNSGRIAKAFRRDLPVLDWDGEVVDGGKFRTSWLPDVRKHLTPAGVEWLKAQRG
jgi:hypothetical protein